MNAKNLLALVVCFFSLTATAWANNPVGDDVLETAVTATTKAAESEAIETAKDIKVNGGYVKFGRDGSVSVVSNGPTVGQRVYLAGAKVVNGVIYAAYTTYEGAKFADGQVAAFVWYPIGKVGEWVSSKPATATPDASVKIETPVGAVKASVDIE